YNGRLPFENLLGEENKGWYGLLSVLNPERIGTSIFSLAIAKAAFDYALEYARERKAFGKTIGSFQILQHYLAEIAIEIENAQNLIYKCARLCDAGKRYDVEACMAKVVACRAYELAARYGMEIMGSYGFDMAKDYIGESFGLPRSF